MNKLLSTLAAFTFVLICVCLACAVFAQFVPDTPVTPVAASSSPTPPDNGPITVVIAKGVITVPGSAYLDGRETTGAEPLTLNKINLWKEPGEGFDPLVCHRPHGHPVMVLDTTSIEGRDWFQIDAGDSCMGWVLDSLISPTLEEPVGELWTGD